MISNLDRYKTDLEKLKGRGVDLQNAMSFLIDPNAVRKQLKAELGEQQVEPWLAKLPNFFSEYDSWYSEALVLIRQILPDRKQDFISLYERPKNRKSLQHDNYSMQDFLQGLQRADGSLTMSAGQPKFQQQLSILKACSARFESSLFEIQQLVQADLFDSEIEAARDLNKKGFARAAGIVAGVVLEKHLAQVCADHRVSITKKHAGISDFNEALKAASVISVPQWRHITLMGDIRNVAGHNKGKEPTAEQVDDLLEGVDRILKTIH
jgi:hypothetical protein